MLLRFFAEKNPIFKAMRQVGQGLDLIGRKLEVNPWVDKLQPSLRAVKLGNSAPTITNAFVAPNACVIGNVTIGPSTAIFYAAIVRETSTGTSAFIIKCLHPKYDDFISADVNSIKIGANVTIGDKCMVHCSKDHPTVIGDRVVVGSGAVIHGCHLESECFIGAGAQILDGARVQTNAMVGPGAVLSKGKVVPTGQCWSGIPAVFERNLTKIEIESIGELAEENTELAVLHAQENLKTWEDIEMELFNFKQEVERGPDFYKRLTDEEWSYKMGELENHDIPGRIFDTKVSARTEPDSRP